MAQIARAAGVGMSALYARFGDRQSLLRRFADEGNEFYAAALTRAATRLRQDWSAEQVLRELMTELVVADHHRIWLGIAGTFERSAADVRRSVQLRRRGEALVRRCRAEAALRPGVTWRDLFKAQEMLAAVEGATPRRTRELRLRMLDVVLTGFTTGPALPGRPPGVDDAAENRSPARSAHPDGLRASTR